MNVLSGVLQASVLGSLSFFLYVSGTAANLAVLVGVSVGMFADNCAVNKSVNNSLHRLLLNENVCKIAE